MSIPWIHLLTERHLAVASKQIYTNTSPIYSGLARGSSHKQGRTSKDCTRESSHSGNPPISGLFPYLLHSPNHGSEIAGANVGPFPM